MHREAETQKAKEYASQVLRGNMEELRKRRRLEAGESEADLSVAPTNQEAPLGRSKHINFFEELEQGAATAEGTNVEHEREEKELDIKLRTQAGIMPWKLGDGSLESAGSKAWYENKGFEKGRSGGRHEDWTCPNCSDFQFARNDNCRKCGTPRPLPGQAAAARSRELDEERARKKQDRKKARDDPLATMSMLLDQKRKKESKTKEKSHKHTRSQREEDTLERLRRERTEREKRERDRVAEIMGYKQPEPEKPEDRPNAAGYYSGFANLNGARTRQEWRDERNQQRAERSRRDAERNRRDWDRDRDRGRGGRF
mmetsp:Transcript_71999/g.169464  ORF Transcript_71999/g.169464 Transcript_71999/m.169464 type:complete len:313 (+) Transcript_71999:74-1012(+)